MTNFNVLWEQAIKQYEDQAGHPLQVDDQLRNITTLDDLDKQSGSKEDAFKTFRTHGQKVLKPLKKCLLPLELLLGTGQSVVGLTPFAAGGAVLGAASTLLKACQNVSKAYDNVADLFTQIGAITGRLAVYNLKQVDQRLPKVLVDTLASILQTFGVAEKVMRRNRLKTFLKTLLAEDDDIRTCLSELAQHVTTEQNLVSSLTYMTTLDLQADNVETSRRQDVSALHEILRYPSYERNYAIQASNEIATAEGIATWLQSHHVYRNWRKRDFGLLLVLGGPGMGKSILASQTIMSLQREAGVHDPVGYFYFKSGESAQQTYGFDEALTEQRAAAVAFFHAAILSTTPHELQIVIFARPEIRADHRLTAAAHQTVLVSSDETGPDVKAFVQEQLPRVSLLRVLHKLKAGEFKSLARTIRTSIIAKSEGMFLWAKLMVDRICNEATTSSIVAALEVAPKGLEAAIHSAFRRLEAEEELFGGYMKDLLEQDLKGRYSSILKVTYGSAWFELDEPDAFHESVGKTQSITENIEVSLTAADFDFLDEVEEVGFGPHQHDAMQNTSITSISAGPLISGIAPSEQRSTAISRSWMATKVTFTHARIREVLDSQGRHSATWTDCAIVNKNLYEQDLQMFLMCLDNFEAELDNINFDVREYASRCWWWHLLAGIKDAEDTDLIATCAVRLSNFLNNGKLYWAISRSFPDALGDMRQAIRDNLVPLSQLLQDNIHMLNDRSRSWVLSFNGVLTEDTLWQPFMLHCEQEWLTARIKSKASLDSSPDFDEYIAIILYFNGTSHDTWIDRKMKEIISGSHQLPRTDLLGLLVIARRSSLPRDARWFWNLAVTIEYCSSSSKELLPLYWALYKRALELKPLSQDLEDFCQTCRARMLGHMSEEEAYHESARMLHEYAPDL
ncbi:Hypothetical protein D9617_21g096890 [Elsinoe fawcettii]|nr:Hypothetical protein D9617_21g096890 [Elsinoe fawcettii]